jgi:hypothetical protein
MISERPFHVRIIGLLAGMAFASLSACSRESPEAPTRQTNEIVVNKALDLYDHGKTSRENLRKDFDIVVAHLPNMTCIGLKQKPGVSGADETMCFDKSGRRLVFQYAKNG